MDKKKEITIVLSDLDGTLFTSNTTVSKENKQAIMDYIENGGYFGVATGRSWENASTFLKDISMNAPCILCNGSILFDPIKRQIVEERYLDDEVIEKFVAIAREKFPHVNIIAYTIDSAWILSEEQMMEPAFVDIHKPWTIGCINDIKGRCVKLLCLDKGRQLYMYLKDVLGEEKLGPMEMVLSAPEYLEILPHNVRKGNMLDSLRKYVEEEYHCSCKIYALGDFYNDVELITKADVGIAPANAAEEIKQIADVVSVSNDEHVVAHIIASLKAS